VILSQVISPYYLNRRIRLMECFGSFLSCDLRCENALRDVLDRNERERLLAGSHHLEARFDCGPPIDDAARRCIQDADRAFNEQMARLDASDTAARQTREQCVADCGRQLHQCEAALSGGAVAGSVDVVGTVTAGCLDDGGPCFVPVSDFCQRASGVCDQCTLSLCGGGEWTVETVEDQLLVNTTLVAATDPLKNPRVLATSTTRGNQTLLKATAPMTVFFMRSSPLSGFVSGAVGKGH
jgi:hypothetical protein